MPCALRRVVQIIGFEAMLFAAVVVFIPAGVNIRIFHRPNPHTRHERYLRGLSISRVKGSSTMPFKTVGTTEATNLCPDVPRQETHFCQII